MNLAKKKKLQQINISRTLVTYVYKYSFQDSHLNMKRKKRESKKNTVTNHLNPEL